MGFDAVGCPIDRLREGKIWLYTQKTGQHVYCPLPGFVVKELEAAPRVSDRYWFYSGNGTVELPARSGAKHSPRYSRMRM